jgi:PAS domain-containing protein
MPDPPEAAPAPPPSVGTPAPARPAAAGRATRLLYLGAGLFLLLTAAVAVELQREEQRRIGQGRARAVFELVAERTARRPTDTPGLAAWLALELQQYRLRLTDPEAARAYGELAGWQDPHSVPPLLDPLRTALAAGGGSGASAPANAGGPPAADRMVPVRAVAPAELGDTDSAMPPGALRRQGYIEAGEGLFLVWTRRSGLDGDPEAARFLARGAARLLAAGGALAEALARAPLPLIPDRAPLRVVRLFAVGVDGTLLSLPYAEIGAPPAARRAAAVAEGHEFRKVPYQPNFAANEFLFRFDLSNPRPRAAWSGLYLDLGGEGLVGSVLLPAGEPLGGVLAADLAFDVDWQAFARGIEAPLVAGVVTLPAPPDERFRPWIELHQAALAATAAANPSNAANRGPGSRLAPPLAASLAELAEREMREGGTAGAYHLFHAVLPDRGALAALQMRPRTWLLVLFPETRSEVAWLPLALLAALFLALLVGFEANRRRALRAQRKAEREWREKQNLLDTMQVPLMVVDPNDDVVVHGNRAAEMLGIAAGTRVADLVAPEARSLYEHMQAAGGARRAYGLPLLLRGDHGAVEQRHVVIRSVAVTAPIEALRADQRHRLGVLFVLEPASDLAPLAGALEAATREDERRKLAGLLAHGADTLARVLAWRLERPGDPAFVGWLAEYLERRILATSWLLEHWDSAPPLPPDTAIEPAQARATLERLAAVLTLVRDDPELRSRLHWNNGTLAAAAPRDPVLDIHLEWPEDRWLPCPLRGGFGFFVGEAVVNAVRHGRPGSVPTVSITLDRIRRELLFEVANRPRAEDREQPPRPAATYGGQAILTRLAALFDWHDLRFDPTPALYRVTWRAAVSSRAARDQAD